MNSTSYRALLVIPQIRRILASMALSRIGASMGGVAMVLFALDTYDSPLIAGFVAFAETAPAVVMGPVAGALLDRHGRARLVILDQMVGAVCFILIAWLAFSDQLPAWLFLVVAAMTGITRPLSDSGLRTLLPVIAPRALWERANALDSNAFVIALLVGPALAGVSIAVVGGAGAFVIVASLLLSAGLVLVGLSVPTADQRRSGSLIRDVRDGLRYTWRNRVLRGLAVTMVVYYAGWGVLTIAVPVLLLDHLGQGPAAVGFAWAATAVAGGGAALAFGRRQSAGRERHWLAASMLASGVAVAILLLPEAGVAGVVVVLLTVGFLQGPIDVAMFTLRQRAADPAMFGRAFAVSVALNSAGSPISTAITGAVIAVRLDAAIVLGLLLFVIAAAIAWRALPQPPYGQRTRRVA